MGSVMRVPRRRRRDEFNQEKEIGMRFCHDELTLDDMLNDPLINAVMRADGVDPEELGAELARVAEERDEATAE
jgi:hypothetical protein